MNINIKKRVERDLKEYPYLLIAVDAGGLGYPTRYDIVKDVKHPSDVKESFVENCAINEEENKMGPCLMFGTYTSMFECLQTRNYRKTRFFE